MQWYRGALTMVALGAVLASSVAAKAHVAGTSVRTSVVAARGHDAGGGTTTPITHLVVIFQENVSFDHYFGTYPAATNPPGEPALTPAADTPSVNGFTDGLLSHNPNAANPQRLDRAEALTCDQDHNYAAEQQAFDHGLMDLFVEKTSGSQTGGVTGPDCVTPLSGHTVDTTTNKLVMDYYDGNTVTALWNYAQHFAMSDNSYGTVFGPSTPGALNLISGQTHGATPAALPNAVSNGTVIGDPRPVYDDCYTRTNVISMTGTNVGDLLNAKGITWGWFQGGFRPTTPYSETAPAVCGSAHQNMGGATITDYIPHHEPFQYYQQTANPHHLPPSSVALIGQTDQANHQYDLTDFWAAADSGHLPAVSFLKAAAYQDGHAGYSDPLDEQTFLVNAINHLEQLPTWRSTAVVIAYDDSDGWYDHVMGPILSQSSDPAYDALSDPGQCGTAAKEYGYPDRCGYGPRLPLLVISPYARQNFVDHSLTDQSSILRFIEDNWQLGRIGAFSFDALAGALNNLFRFSGDHPAPELFLDPSTGQPTGGAGPTTTPTMAASATATVSATGTSTGTAVPATSTGTAVATDTGTAVATRTGTAVATDTGTSAAATSTGTVVSATSTATPVSATSTGTGTAIPATVTPTETAGSPTPPPVCQLFVSPAFETVPRGGEQALVFETAPGAPLTVTIRARYPIHATLFTFGDPTNQGGELTGTPVSRGYRYTFRADQAGLTVLLFAIPRDARGGTVAVDVAASESCGLFKTVVTFEVRGRVQGASTATPLDGRALTLAVVLPRGNVLPASTSALRRRGVIRVVMRRHGTTVQRVLLVTYHPRSRPPYWAKARTSHTQWRTSHTQ